MYACMYTVYTDHEGEDNRHSIDHLDGVEAGQTYHLDKGEQVYPAQAHLTQKHVVRLVLRRHEQDQETLNQLKPKITVIRPS